MGDSDGDAAVLCELRTADACVRLSRSAITLSFLARAARKTKGIHDDSVLAVSDLIGIDYQAHAGTLPSYLRFRVSGDTDFDRSGDSLRDPYTTNLSSGASADLLRFLDHLTEASGLAVTLVGEHSVLPTAAAEAPTTEPLEPARPDISDPAIHYCSACGTSVPGDAHFCPRCGRAQAALPASTEIEEAGATRFAPHSDSGQASARGPLTTAVHMSPQDNKEALPRAAQRKWWTVYWVAFVVASLFVAFALVRSIDDDPVESPPPTFADTPAGGGGLPAGRSSQSPATTLAMTYRCVYEVNGTRYQNVESMTPEDCASQFGGCAVNAYPHPLGCRG